MKSALDSALTVSRRNANNAADAVSARTVMYCMSLSGFVVSYMLRSDINVAIVMMVPPVRSIDEVPVYSCQAAHNEVDMGRQITDDVYDVTNTTTITPSIFETTNSSHIPTQSTMFADEGYLGKYIDWTDNQKSIVLSSYYWMYVMTQILGAIATQRWGMKYVYGCAHVIASICSFLIPTASYVHFGLAILMRSIQGFVLGFTWPAIFSCQQYWFPKHERTSFLTSFQGFNLGIGISYPVCGLIIEYFDWETVFYTSGVIGLSWCVVWFSLVHNSPEQHPRISAAEKQYIRSHLDQPVSYDDSKAQRIPWGRIVTSGQVLLTGLASFGWIWVNYVFIIGAPGYIKKVHGFDIGKSGFLSGLPFILCFPLGFLMHFISSKLVEMKLMSAMNVRKLFTVIAIVVPGFMCFIIGQLECNTPAVLVCILIACTLPSAIFSGCIANISAIAPVFGAPTIAFVQTMYMSGSFICPLVTFHITQTGYDMDAWKLVYNMATAVSIITVVPYLIWANDKPQDWNYPHACQNDKSDQMVKMIAAPKTPIVKASELSGDDVRKSSEAVC